jgi:hypothetical protein
MNTDEVIDLLTLAASYDRRKVGESDVAAWGLAIGDLPFADTREAVIAHYRESTDWIMPAHVRQRVREVRAKRLKAAGDLEARIPEELADRPIEYARRLKEIADAVRDDQPAPKAIEGAQ